MSPIHLGPVGAIAFQADTSKKYVPEDREQSWNLIFHFLNPHFFFTKTQKC